MRKVQDLVRLFGCRKYSGHSYPAVKKEIGIMKKNLICAMGLKWIVYLSLGLAGSVHASPLSNNPLFLGGNISPNVMFTLDDSGSMHWEMMPEASVYSYFLFPRAASVYNSGSDYGNYVPTFEDGFSS